MKRKFLMVALMVLITYFAAAQQKVDAQIGQDFRLAVRGADKQNPSAFVLNSLVRIKAEAYQDKYGYAFVMPEFEYADLLDNYKRYSLNVGYSFNKLFLNNLEITSYVGYGIIGRFGKSFNSFNLGGEINYNITEDLKAGVNLQLTERKELKWRYGDKVTRASIFITVSYTIFKIK